VRKRKDPGSLALDRGALGKKAGDRVLFLYPTRGTATEGFRDYVSWAPAEEAALAHGTAAYDLEEMFENPADSHAEKDFTSEDRLYALGSGQNVSLVQPSINSSPSCKPLWFFMPSTVVGG